MSKMASKGVDSRDSCSVCLEPYRGRQPKLLPCSHTFCLPCLKEIATKEEHQSNKGQGKLTCPTCRTSTPLPPGGVACLQDITVHGSGKTGDGDPRPLLCDLCEEGQEAEAKLTCATCQTCFCTRCRRCHDKLCKTGQVTEIKVQRQEEKVEDMDVKGLASALSQLMKKHTEMQELFGALQDRNAVLEKRCQIMERELASLRDKSAIVNQDNQSLRDDVVNVKNDLAQGQAHLTRIQESVSAVQTQQDKVQGDVNTLTADHGTMKASQTVMESKMHKNVDTLTTEQATLKSSRLALESKIESVIQDQKKLATLTTDQSTLKANQKALEFQLQSIIQEQKVLATTEVAFQAFKSDPSSKKMLYAGDAVICKGIKLSVGGGYNPDTGVFQAPVSGLYCFMVSATADNDDPGKRCSLQLMVNDKVLDGLHAYGNGQSTSHGCVQLKAGETVWLKVSRDASYEPFVSFTGFLIQPHF